MAPVLPRAVWRFCPFLDCSCSGKAAEFFSMRIFLDGWPKVFVDEIARFAPGGLAFEDSSYRLKMVVIMGCAAGGLLLLLFSWLTKEPGIRILAVTLLGFSWLAGYLGGELCRGRPTLPN